MAEPEDIILHAAEQVSAAAGAWWHRRRPPPSAPGVGLDEISRHLGLLIQACVGQAWPLLPADPEAAPSWLARRLRRLPPWMGKSPRRAFSDGVQIFLPRHLQASGDGTSTANLLRLTALMLAVRLARGSVTCCPVQPVARDLFWVVDAIVVEDRLTTEFPGLATDVRAAQQWARASRPPLHVLSPGERSIESLVQKLLAVPTNDARHLLPQPPPHLLHAPGLAQWAIQVADQPPFRQRGLYRGMAPVLHWGCPRPDLVQGRSQHHGTRQASLGHSPPARSQRLPHHVEAEELQPEINGRSGPFLLPHDDPQQTVDKAAGKRRPPDQQQDLELDILAEELARLGQVTRLASDSHVQEILESDASQRGRCYATKSGEHEGASGILYPEWDYRLGGYRQQACLVREVTADSGDAEWSAKIMREQRALIQELRRRFETFRPLRHRNSQQVDGTDIDIDAHVDDYASRHADQSPTDRLYVSDRPRRRDVAVAFLLDVSGSTDAWVSGRRRVLDIAKEATLLFCEALDALGDRYAVYSFASRGARDVRVGRLKHSVEPYGEAVRQRLAGLSSAGYTRLGAAIRHLTAQLARQRARLRLVLLLSDGKPNDEDAYDGTYGLEDTRQAVAEARRQGIQLFCLTIDRHGSVYLPHMFGPHSYGILWDIRQLPQRLPDLYRRLTISHG